jgi:hypothetical protein
MKHKRKVKDPANMTDKQLLHDIFPKEIIRELKRVALKSRKKSKVKFHRAK